MMLGAFWQTYQATNPGHPVFSTPFDLKGCVPIFLHGDEGRGLARRPFMVLSWQTVISHHGPGVCNDSTHSFTTRFLFSAISASLYDGDRSLDDLLDEFATELIDIAGIRLRIVCIGAKGVGKPIKFRSLAEAYDTGLVIAWLEDDLHVESVAFANLAGKAFSRELKLYKYRPKFHLGTHLALDLEGEIYDVEPPSDDNERRRLWTTLEEVTARRRLCRQLLKNIQTALQCSEVLQAGLAHVFQGPLMDALKTALKEPQKVGVSLFGTAIDIVSSIIQDDPSRVPQMIESGVLPGILAALNKETLRSAECLSFVPGVLASIALHAVGEDFLLNSPSKPIQLLTEILVDTNYAPLLHSQPEIAQIMSTQVDKVLRNRPSGPSKLTEHVVECMLSAMRGVIEEAKAYPDWTPLDLQDHTQYLADRLAPFSRFCWSILQTNEQTLKAFLEKKGLALVRQLQELP
ncbi:unnamed protein product, partial [Cladocopium goreaui]